MKFQTNGLIVVSIIGLFVLIATPRSAPGIGAPMAIETAYAAGGSSLRFFGTGRDDVDRVKIRIDNPARPADVSGNLTIEFWMKADPNGVTSASCQSSTSQGDLWINGNSIIDRDIYDQPTNGDYGISLYGNNGGQLAFGIAKASSGETLCGGSNLADGNWHHIAATRNTSTGLMQLYVDGVRVAQGTGPTGDISYSNGRSSNYPNSDPYLVIGAEKHDAGSNYPSFSGWVDELRISNTVRYIAASFSVPTEPFSSDANTVALYHFDEGSGTTLGDSSGASGGPSDGVVMFNQAGAAPLWSSDTPWGETAATATPTGTRTPTATPTGTRTPTATPTATPLLHLTATVLPERNYLPHIDAP
ncbi:MAG: LamG domain-containing protein [Roseiflexaceae bacterium]